MNKTLISKPYSLSIGWLYPDLMSTYGDRGNILVLQKRCEWRGIESKIIPINHESNLSDLKNIDFIFGGGSQDREQEIVMRDLKGKKQEIIKHKIEENTPALFVCGSPQLMGKYYEPAVGQRIEGLGIFDMVSKNPGPDVPRCIGNIVAEVEWQNLNTSEGVASLTPGRWKPAYTSLTLDETHNSRRPDSIGASPLGGSLITHNFKNIVGFENHGGRSYLGSDCKPFAKVIKGNGNNGEDGTEGMVYKNAIGCYFHGPFLPKNPLIADFIIQRALEVKYKKQIELELLDNSLEMKAHDAIVKKLGINE